MDTQMDTPTPRSPLTGCPSWEPLIDAQPARGDASRVTLGRHSWGGAAGVVGKKEKPNRLANRFPR